MDAITTLSDEDLAEQIVTWSGRLAAGEAHLLALIREFDRREGWAGPGLLSCAHGLAWRTGLGPNAARERVRVARRLNDLPDIAEAFASGRMSWSQVRAVTRVAAPDDGVDWVDLARHASTSQLERIVRGVRRVQSITAAEADPEVAQHRMRTRTSYDEDGTMVITIRAAAEDGAVILAGLAATRAELERQRAGDVSAETPAGPGDVSAETPAAILVATQPVPVTDSDALLEMARRALDHQQAAHPEVARRRRAALVAQVDPLSGWARLRDGELLPPSSLRNVLRTLPGRTQLRHLAASDLTQHDLGRTSRHPSLALRELIGTLDGERCRFPGCTRRRRLHAHHVQHWADGGRTDLDNLVLVCGRHHTLIHTLAFRLTLHADRRLEVATAAGAPVLHHPRLPWGAREDLHGQPVAAEPTDSRMNLGYVVSVLLQQAA